MVERASGIELGRRGGVSGPRGSALWGALRSLGALLVAAAPLVVAAPSALAQESPTHIYWTNAGTGMIGRANLDGSEPNPSFIAGASEPWGVAVDGSYVYWTNSGTHTIGRANLNGTGAVQDFITGASEPYGVAVDGSYVYWANQGTNSIGRANLDGSEPNPSFITGARLPYGVAVEGAHIYWTNLLVGSGAIGRANLDGTGAVQDFITGASDPYDVEVDGSHVYWANAGAATIGRASPDDPDGANHSFITGTPAVTSVAVGPGADPPAAAVAPETVAFGEVIVDEASGPQTVTVTNVGVGTLTLDAAGLAGDNPDQFTIASDGCANAELAADEPCEIALRFTPTFTGAKTATLEVAHNGPNSPATVALTGTGVAPPTWTISGTIMDETDTAVAGVTVTLSGGPGGTQTTDTQGTYIFAGVAAGEDYTVTPSLGGYTFDPPSQPFEDLSADATADFTATAVELTITGTVVDEEDAPLAGVTVALSGDDQAEATTDADGTFAFEALTWGGTYTVTPTHADYHFTPESRELPSVEENAQVSFSGTRLTAAYTRYFGEGAIGPFFDTTFALFNPGDEDAAATLTFAGEGGDVVPHNATIPAGAQVVVNPETLLPEEWVGFATAIEADQVLVTSRTMRWDDRHYGRHESAGVATPQAEWWFTEGATGTFQLFYLLYNPHDQAAEVTATYYRGAEQGVATRTYTVGPHTRRTVFVNVAADGQTPDPELGATEVSAHIVSTNGVPIVAERAMYLTTDAAQPLTAGTLAPGVTEPAMSWHFAEGATDFFDLFLLLANPSAAPVDATVRYLLPTGDPIARTYTLEPESRRTIWVDQEDPALAATQVAITVQSEAPILAERAMWWGARGAWDSGHVSTGAARPATRWGLAGLTLAGADDAEAYVLIANPNAAEAEATLTLITPTGARAPVNVPLAPWTRTTLRLRDLFQNVDEDAVAVLVESTAGENPVPLVVEGAAYASPDGRALSTGSATPALPLPE